MQPCAACNRHVREVVCPFCGHTAAKREAIDPGAGRFSRAMVFAGATIAASAGCAHKQKPLPPPPEMQYQNHPCGVDQNRVDEAKKKLDEAKTDDEKQAAQRELDDARTPVCAPYGAPPARRRIV